VNRLYLESSSDTIKRPRTHILVSLNTHSHATVTHRVDVQDSLRLDRQPSTVQLLHALSHFPPPARSTSSTSDNLRRPFPMDTAPRSIDRQHHLTSGHDTSATNISNDRHSVTISPYGPTSSRGIVQRLPVLMLPMGLPAPSHNRSHRRARSRVCFTGCLPYSPSSFSGLFHGLSPGGPQWH
jgi:hypothetical protein